MRKKVPFGLLAMVAPIGLGGQAYANNGSQRIIQPEYTFIDLSPADIYSDWSWDSNKVVAASSGYQAGDYLQQSSAPSGYTVQAAVWSGTAASATIIALPDSAAGSVTPCAIANGNVYGTYTSSSTYANQPFSYNIATQQNTDLNLAIPGSAASWPSPTLAGAGGTQLVGNVHFPPAPSTSDSYEPHAMLWSGSTGIDLNPDGYTKSSALATDGLQQVGYGLIGPGMGTGLSQPLLWNGSANAVNLIQGTSWDLGRATGVSNGQQVGYAANLGGSFQAMLWSGNASSGTDLNPTGFASSQATAIASGFVAGQATTAGQVTHAVVWTVANGNVTNLDLDNYIPGNYAGPTITMNAYATSVDSHGDVAGYLQLTDTTTYTSTTVPVLWQLNRQPVFEDFTKPGATLQNVGLTLTGSGSTFGASFDSVPAPLGGNQSLHLSNSGTDPNTWVAVDDGGLGLMSSFSVSFQYAFDTPGKLQVLLDGQILDTIQSPGPGQLGYADTGWAAYNNTFTIPAPDLAGTLEFKLSNVGDPDIYLNGIQVTNSDTAPVPEPATTLLLSAGGLGWLARRRKRIAVVRQN